MNIKKVIGYVLAVSPLGTVVTVAGRLTGMEWQLAYAAGGLFAVAMLIGLCLILGEGVTRK